MIGGATVTVVLFLFDFRLILFSAFPKFQLKIHSVPLYCPHKKELLMTIKIKRIKNILFTISKWFG
jgi:hypothetical protein